MPFKSQAQRRFFHAANRRGEISDAVLRRWEKETPKGKKLPERKMNKSAAFDAGIQSTMRKHAGSEDTYYCPTCGWRGKGSQLKDGKCPKCGKSVQLVKRASMSDGRAPTAEDKTKIQNFLRKSRGLKDSGFHAFAKRLGVNVHKAEEVAYAMARALAGGEAEGKKGRPDPKQLAMGKRVEMEHTKVPEVAEEITRDHLAEIPDYYTRLHKMEAEAKKSAAGAKT